MKYKYKSKTDNQTENGSTGQEKNKKKPWSADVYVRPFGYFKIITHRPRAKYIFNNERRDVSFSKLYEEEFKKLAVTVYNIMEKIEKNYKDSTIKIKTFLRKLPAGFFRVKQIKDKQQNLIKILVDKRRMKLLEKNKYNSAEIDEKITAYAKKLNSKYTNKKQKIDEKITAYAKKQKIDEKITAYAKRLNSKYTNKKQKIDEKITAYAKKLKIDEKITAYAKKLNSKYTNKKQEMVDNFNKNISVVYDETHPKWKYQQEINKFVPSPTDSTPLVTDAYGTNSTTDITKTPVPKVVTDTSLINTAGDTPENTETTPLKPKNNRNKRATLTSTR